MNLRSPANQSYVGAFYQNIGFPNLTFETFHWNIFDGRPIQSFRFEDNARVLIVYTGQQQTFGFVWTSRHNNF